MTDKAFGEGALQPMPAPFCALSGRCGGCEYMGISYAEQLQRKQQRVEDLFSGIGFHEVEPIVGMQRPYHYRCKVQTSCQNVKDGRRSRIRYGNYEPMSHRLVETQDCLIEDETCQAVIHSAVELANEFHYSAYDERSREGLLRHILVRRGYYSGQILLVLVTGSRVFPGKNNFVRELRRREPNITTVVQNINGNFGSAVLGQKSQTVYGPGTIIDTMLGKTFRISASSFYQVNPPQTEKLYQTAIKWAAGRESGGTLLDAYCGTGTISLLSSPYFDHVIGVERNPEAVRDAQKNAALNRVENCAFVACDAGEYLVTNEVPDTVMVDPPRTGLDKRFVRRLCEARPARIVYISCGPETQVRDIAVLKEAGYEVKRVRPYDLFPFTGHNVKADTAPSITLVDSLSLSLEEGQTERYWKEETTGGSYSLSEVTDESEIGAGSYNYRLLNDGSNYVLELHNVQLNSDSAYIGLMVSGAPVTLRYYGDNKIIATNYGIILDASGAFRIEDGNADSGEDSLTAATNNAKAGMNGLYCGGELTFHGGKVTATTDGLSQGILGNEIMVEGGAEVNAAGSVGILCSTLTVAKDAGNVQGTGKNQCTAIGIGVSELYFEADNATLTGISQGTYSYGNPPTGHGITADKAFFTGEGNVVASTNGNGYALSGGSELHIQNGHITATATNGGTAIYCGGKTPAGSPENEYNPAGPSVMEISGDAVVEAEGSRAGIKVNEIGDGTLTISGDPQITASGGNLGISVGGVDLLQTKNNSKDPLLTIFSGKLEITGGTVTVTCTGAGPAIHANDALTVSGGTVNAVSSGKTAVLTGIKAQALKGVSEYYHLVKTDGKINVSGGEFIAKADGTVTAEWFDENHTGNAETTRLGIPDAADTVLSSNELHLTGGHFVADGQGSAENSVEWTSKSPFSSLSEIAEPYRFKLSPDDEYQKCPKEEQYQWNEKQSYIDIDFNIPWQVTFDGKGGSETESQIVINGQTVIIPENPVRSSYTFAGWCTDEACTQMYDFELPVRDDLTLYASWTPVEYIIEYELNGGENASSNPVSYTIETDDIALAAPVRNGYSFAGWFTTQDFSGNPVMVIRKGNVGDMILYAKWTKNEEPSESIGNESSSNGEMSSQESNANNPAGSNPITSQGAETAKTGDASHVSIWSVLFALALGAVILAIQVRKRKAKEK